jgi:hypothetical protein
VLGDLGLGDMAARGDGAGEMGDALPAIDLGLGKKAAAIAAGSNHTCAHLSDGTVKCWGFGAVLGLGASMTRGDKPGQMGEALPTVKLFSDSW